jgi:hypothetical protein
MPLGYVLTMKDVIHYYTEREDVRRALLSHGRRRRVVSGTDTGIFGQKGKPLSEPGQIAEMMERSLEKQISAIPRKYPSFHACITRMPANGNGKHGDIGINNDTNGNGHRNDTLMDVVMDIVIKDNHKAAWAQGRKVLDVLESYEVPYRVKFSGHASPHILLPGELFPPEFNRGKGGGFLGRLIDFLTRKSKATNVDGSFSSPDHYLRMPYSLNEHTGLVSVPVRDGEYDSFRVEMAEAQNVEVREDWMAVSDRGGIDNLLAAAGVGR